MEIQPPCPRCGQTCAVVKAGLNRSGSQRHRCPACQRYFTAVPKPAGHAPATRELAVRLYLEGTSFRGIAKVLRVNHASIINWVNAAARALPAVVTDPTPTETVETDELFTFIGKKRAGLRCEVSGAGESLAGRRGSTDGTGVGSAARLCRQFSSRRTLLLGRISRLGRSALAAHPARREE